MRRSLHGILRYALPFGIYKNLLSLGVIAMERMKGLDFTYVESNDTLCLDKRFSFGYSPFSQQILETVLKKYTITEDDAILDVGCGKGLALCAFAKFPFGRIDGLDVSQKLVAIAKANLEKLKLKIDIFHEDARFFTNLDKYSWLYLYNPFPASVVQDFLENTIASLARKPRLLYLLYCNPMVGHKIVLQHFSLHSSNVFEYWGKDIDVNVYISKNYPNVSPNAEKTTD